MYVYIYASPPSHIPHNMCPCLFQAAFYFYRAFGGLTSIDVSGTAITDDGLQLVLGAGKELHSLGLRDLPGLTDRGLAAILQCIKRRRRLQELKLCRSLRFTDDGEQAVFKVDILALLPTAVQVVNAFTVM